MSYNIHMKLINYEDFKKLRELEDGVYFYLISKKDLNTEYPEPQLGGLEFSGCYDGHMSIMPEWTSSSKTAFALQIDGNQTDDFEVGMSDEYTNDYMFLVLEKKDRELIANRLLGNFDNELDAVFNSELNETLYGQFDSSNYPF